MVISYPDLLLFGTFLGPECLKGSAALALVMGFEEMG